jgi:hypothetical protein
MSPSVMTLPARNFKFLTEGFLERTGNYRLCEKEGRGRIWLGDPFWNVALLTSSSIFDRCLQTKSTSVVLWLSDKPVGIEMRTRIDRKLHLGRRRDVSASLSKTLLEDKEFGMLFARSRSG